MFDFEQNFSNLLTKLCLQLSQKQSDDLISLLKKQGNSVERNGDLLEIKSDARTCYIHLGDKPIEQLSPLMRAIVGPLWKVAFLELFENVKQSILQEIN